MSAVLKKENQTVKKILTFKRKRFKPDQTENLYSLEDLLKIYPGLKLENSALLANAHKLLASRLTKS